MQDTEIRVLKPSGVTLMRGMLHLFGSAFEDFDTYITKQPDDAYLNRLLSDRHFIAIAALIRGEVVGGLVAYVLPKFEQARSEVYIYDVAVEKAVRRQGIATALIRAVQIEAAVRGATVVFVQADCEDREAVALYAKLGPGKEVLHFDLMSEEQSAQINLDLG